MREDDPPDLEATFRDGSGRELRKRIPDRRPRYSPPTVSRVRLVVGEQGPRLVTEEER